MKKYLLLLAAGLFLFCTNSQAQAGPVVEGEESGFYFRDTRECLATESQLADTQELFVSPHGDDGNRDGITSIGLLF